MKAIGARVVRLTDIAMRLLAFFFFGWLRILILEAFRWINTYSRQ